MVGKYTIHGWYGFPKWEARFTINIDTKKLEIFRLEPAFIRGWTAGFEMSVLWPSSATSKVFFIRKSGFIGPYHCKETKGGWWLFNKHSNKCILSFEKVAWILMMLGLDSKFWCFIIWGVNSLPAVCFELANQPWQTPRWLWRPW